MGLAIGSAINPFNLPTAFAPPPAAAPAVRAAAVDTAATADAGAPPGRCSSVQLEAARRYASAATTFVAEYRFLLECHPTEYLTSAPMAQLPEGWATAAVGPELVEQLHLIDGIAGPFSPVLPLAGPRSTAMPPTRVFVHEFRRRRRDCAGRAAAVLPGCACASDAPRSCRLLVGNPAPVANVDNDAIARTPDWHHSIGIEWHVYAQPLDPHQQ